MEIDEETPSASAAEPTPPGADADMMATSVPATAITGPGSQSLSTIPTSVVLPPAGVPPSVPPTVIPLSAPPPVLVPPMAPLPAVPPAMPRPLAPLPVRPPVTQNGEVKASDTDSDDDDQDSDMGVEGSSAGYEITEESRQVRERQEKAMREFMMKRRAAALAVPTNDMSVRTRLRRLGEPITLFGEREMERRDRLRMLMAKLDAEGQLEKLMKAHEEEEEAASAKDEVEEEMLQYPFYTEGTQELLDARKFLVKFSIVRASQRLQRARRKRDDPDEDEDAEIDWALRQAGTFVLDSSEIGDDRPLCGCSFSKDGNSLATCSVSGVAKIWSMPEVKKVSALKGHTVHATDVAFSPVSDNVATASADRTAKLWNTDGTLLRTFEGHLDRLARIAFHPSGKYLGTTSFDKTWRLWDIESGAELLLQEGHSRSVYAISFHPDGSLVASCGLDSLTRVWDLRTGRSILALEGHIKPVYGVDFSPNGYHLATGSEDNTCRIWDLRKKKSLYIIPAHSKLISQVKFEPQEGYYLVTASYDTTVKVWSSRDFKLIRTLSGHEARVTSLDVTGGEIQGCRWFVCGLRVVCVWLEGGFVVVSSGLCLYGDFEWFRDGFMVVGAVYGVGRVVSGV
ncbi:U4/U6 small nuclear ribonucleoprotein PRP4-like protein isoform X1 [Spinacia oleracea]|uniref:U4/U6 small nuclear ribonucleoprotein PRP4-like protein isoform X1 n=1 Tax=Spinacia oleracea TaxID=3562 RepID=A0ABM3RAW5_SPIOL|nr:U4/U6 small nuclear ribonucleoprotein PRP4-like protein isoform X1 [Spinacia oleracea]